MRIIELTHCQHYNYVNLTIKMSLLNWSKKDERPQKDKKKLDKLTLLGGHISEIARSVQSITCNALLLIIIEFNFYALSV